MRVYVASSWRNELQPAVVVGLREDGHDVYDFREPKPGELGFSWHEIDNRVPPGPANLHLPAVAIRDMLGHPRAVEGFKLDMDALRWCDACVLVLPCGRSAHLEAGWAAGAGKQVIVLLEDGEPDLMWCMAHSLCVDLDEVRDVLAMTRAASPSGETLDGQRCSRCAEPYKPGVGFALGHGGGMLCPACVLPLSAVGDRDIITPAALLVYAAPPAGETGDGRELREWTVVGGVWSDMLRVADGPHLERLEQVRVREVPAPSSSDELPAATGDEGQRAPSRLVGNEEGGDGASESGQPSPDNSEAHDGR